MPKGVTITCPKCGRVFLPIVTAESAPAPVEAAAPAPAAAAAAAPPPMRETRQIRADPQRVKVTSCPKCKALLRLAAGDSRFGKCTSCGHVFVFHDKAISELVMPAGEVNDLPLLELFNVADGPSDEGGRTIMRTTTRMADVPEKAKEVVHCVLTCDSPRIRYEVKKEVVLIGRVNADLTVNDPDVSRRHCTIEQSGGKLIVRDLKSTNGTIVNGVRAELEVLKDGDRIKVGSTELRLVVTSEGEREKHAALFIDIGPGAPADVKQCLDVMNRWALEDLAEWSPDMILSPATGRGIVIWRWNPVVSADERRRLLPKLLMAPAALRVELGTMPLPSGQSIKPLIGLVMGLAKRSLVSGRAKFEGQLLQKAALAVKVPGRDAVFVSDIESLELLTGEKGAEALAVKLHDFGLRATPAGGGHPFVLVQSAEALKKDMKAAAVGAQSTRALRQATSTLENEVLDLLEGKCAKEFDAGVALAFAASDKGVSGVFRRLKASRSDGEDKNRTQLYTKLLKGSAIYLGKDEVVRWMELLRDIGLRYPDALRAERERAASSRERGSEHAWDDLLSLDDVTLLAASEAAVLFRAAFFRGQRITNTDLQKLARQCSEALAASVPAKFAPVPLPVLGHVYGIFKDAIDVPTDNVDARALFEMFALLSLAGVTSTIADEALRRAQHTGDADEVRAVKENYGPQIRIMREGLGKMTRIVEVLRLMPTLRTVASAKSIFDRYQLPAYALLQPLA